MGKLTAVGTLDAIRDRLGRAAVFLDFDGTLADIVIRPEEARAAHGVHDALETLARRAALVSIVTGRPGAFIAETLAAEGVEVHGLYGLEADPPDLDAVRRMQDLEPFVLAEAATVSGAWVERKGLSLAVHYREAADPDDAEEALRHDLSDLAELHGFHLLTGKRVFEIAAGKPSKGTLVERLSREREVEAVAFAGDDVADLDAFDALDRLAAEGMVTARIAVRGAETPQALLDRADTIAEGPSGLVAMLRALSG